MNPALAGAAVAAVCLATVLLGTVGMRLSRTTSDFYVASRSVGPWWNASAISGEYLSAASFLGIAGLILAYGVDMLWYPVGYAAGYLVLLLFVAAPMRRSGAYTLPDFAEERLGSLPVRRICTVLVITICWLYLLPQLQGAGLVLQTVTGAPPWVGTVVVAAVVLGNVAAGGMRSVTFVQAFQYWFKLTALLAPLVLILLLWGGGPATGGTTDLSGAEYPTTREQVSLTVAQDVTVDAPQAATVQVAGTLDEAAVDGEVMLEAGRHTFGAGTELTLPAGTVVPQRVGAATVDNWSWLRPLHGASSGDYPLYATYSLILATFLGTMGLPHVIVRFYTNPDGRAARRTTVGVLGLVGLFYLLPTAYGVLARQFAPDLLVTGRTDTAVLLVPERVLGGTLGQALAALITAGAFAAFLSTSSGLVVSVAGVLGQDVLGRLPAVRGFRLATVAAVAVPCTLSILAVRLPVADAVGLAFAVAASSFCPLLLLGIWWRGLTVAGAATGLLVGGGAATLAVLITIVDPDHRGWLGAALQQPAAWAVPLAFVTMVTVSLATRRSVPAGTARALARMHTPERLTARRAGTDRSSHR
ncbi:MAG TPA: cation acetate symporter [Candidatus Nanopelagicales bacterium]|jgi:Na+(H+)/acetate symporter ActP|nr:cation acetate symporter [Candidatus Nanopelagicales bacterium]